MRLTQLDADLTEEQLIQQYDSRNINKGYNISAGGNTTPRTPEIIAKLSDSLIKYYKTHDGWLKGKKNSQKNGKRIFLKQVLVSLELIMEENLIMIGK